MYIDPSGHWNTASDNSDGINDSARSLAAQAQILQATADYLAAKDKGNTTAMNAAHQMAEDARDGKIYYSSTGVTASQINNQLNTVLGSKYAAQSAKNDLKSSSMTTISASVSAASAQPFAQQDLNVINQARKNSNVFNPNETSLPQGTGNDVYTNFANQYYNDAVTYYNYRKDYDIMFTPYLNTVNTYLDALKYAGIKQGSDEYKMAVANIYFNAYSQNKIAAANYSFISENTDPTMAMFALALGVLGKSGGVISNQEISSLEKSYNLMENDETPITGSTFEGKIYRSVAGSNDPLEIHQGNVNANHRYTASGTGGLYFSTNESTVNAELNQWNVPTQGRTIYSNNVKIENMLDLSNPNVIQKLGVKLEDLTGDSYAITQEIGAYAKQNGYNGIIAPSARADGGLNIIVFDSSSLQPIK